MTLRLAAIACLAMAAATFQAVSAAAPSVGGTPRVRLLDVPYVSQTEALCGGASLAMVLRYWGETTVLAEDFAHLVEPGAGGIRTDVLVEAVRSRGWAALPVTGDPELIQRHLAAGRPMIALTGDRSDVSHYVVLVGWANGSVIVHDPAIGPDRVVPENEFAKGWHRSGNWTLLILPPATSGEPTESDITTTDSLPDMPDDGCAAIVEVGVRQARSGDAAGAERTLMAAAALCPASAAPLRELAGLAFNASDWAGAARLAERALRLEPGDPHTLRLLAGSLFLAGNMEGALSAWNQVSEPRMDLARIDGLVRTRHRAVSDQLDLPPHRIITPGDFRRARRRLAELPAHLESRLSLKPLAGGTAQVNAAVLERPLLFDGPWAAGGAAVRSVVDREISIDVASPSGRGELWTVQYRWWRERPRFHLALAIPATGGRPGVWRVDGLWEDQTYGAREAVGARATDVLRVIKEQRQRASLAYSDWIGPDLRLEACAALDTWRDRGSFASLGATLEARSAQDRLALVAEVSGWAGSGEVGAFRASRLLLQWRPDEASRSGCRARLGVDGVSSEAPLALWPGAGTGPARTPLLRAHPLLEAGVLNGRVFGRTLVHGGLEMQRWPWILGPLRLGWAAFVDGAKPWGTLTSESTPWQVDAGIGVRLSGMGRHSQLRVDAARGFEDRELALSVAWETR